MNKFLKLIILLIFYKCIIWYILCQSFKYTYICDNKHTYIYTFFKEKVEVRDNEKEKWKY